MEKFDPGQSGIDGVSSSLAGVEVAAPDEDSPAQ
eukprot:COSAG06_NODE_64529_length_259_cov_0.650000_1_plen_33_part_01